MPISSSNPFFGDTNVEHHSVSGVGHQSLTADQGSQQDVLAALGLTVTSGLPIHTGFNILATILDIHGYIKAGLSLDPVGAILTDDQGQRLGYTRDRPSGGIPNSVFLGDDTLRSGSSSATGRLPCSSS